MWTHQFLWIKKSPMTGFTNIVSHYIVMCVDWTGEWEEPPAAGPGGRGGGDDHHGWQPEQGRREIRQTGRPGEPSRRPAGKGNKHSLAVEVSGERAHGLSVHRRLGIKARKCHIDVYKYTLGGAGEENKCTIYILIVFYGAIFREVFPIVFLRWMKGAGLPGYDRASPGRATRQMSIRGSTSGSRLSHISPPPSAWCYITQFSERRRSKNRRTTRQEEEVFIVKCLQCRVVRSCEVMLSLDFAMSRNPSQKQNHISRLDVTMCVWTS